MSYRFTCSKCGLECEAYGDDSWAESRKRLAGKVELPADPTCANCLALAGHRVANIHVGSR